MLHGGRAWSVACGGQGHHVVSSCTSVSGGDVTGGDWCRRSVVVMLLGGRASSMDFGGYIWWPMVVSLRTSV